jgi:signal peptidase II
VVFLVAAVVVLLDQVAKAVALNQLQVGESVEVLGPLSWTLVMNTGAAFGLAQGQTVLITVLAVGISVLIALWARRLFSTPWAVALGLMLGGSIGNLVDRVLRDPEPFRGAVVDFIDLGIWPVFNVADMGVVCGAAAVVLLSVLGVPHDRAEVSAATDPPES